MCMTISCSLLIGSFFGNFIPDHRHLSGLWPLSLFHSFQAEHHVTGTVKVSFVPAPAHTAFAMLQSVELAFHFTAAFRTDFIVLAHLHPF